MTTGLQAPFEVTLGIHAQAGERPPATELERLRRIVLGKETGLSRPAAMDLLAGTDYPNVHRDLESVLLNETESSRTRVAAGMMLWRLGSGRAADSLEQALTVRDERVLTCVLTALGRIGSATTLAAIGQARRHATGLARAQADFAATLIAYRFGLPGHVVRTPDSKAFLTVRAGEGHTFRVTRADSAETELGLRSLGYEPFGVELSERDVYRLRCDGADWLLLLNRELSAADSSMLGGRKMVAAVVASKHKVTGRYSTMFLVLTSPTRTRRAAAVTVHRGSGELMFAGEARVEGNQVEFAVRAVKEQGAFPLRFSGLWTAGQLAAREAVSGRYVSIRRAPTPGAGPGVQT